MRTRLAILLLLAPAVLPYRSEARLPATSQQPNKIPGNLSVADWSAIRAEYDRHRRSFFPVAGEYHVRSYSQQWLARLDGRGFEVKPNEDSWTWGLELSSYGFAGSERMIQGRAAMAHDVDHASYRWNAEIEEWFVNEPQGLEHGFTIAQRPAHPNGPLALHLNVRGGLIAKADGNSAMFLDRDGTVRITYSNLQVTDARGRTSEARMLAEPSGLRIEVEESGAVYPIRIDPIVQQAYLKASNAEANDQFGRPVAISGNTVVVGAISERSNATGVNGNQSDNSLSFAGAAYVFVRNGATWNQQAYLKAPIAIADAQFGSSVTIFGDTAIVGAAGNSAAYVFVRSGTAWSRQADLKGSNTDLGDFFGRSVAIFGDTAIVGANGESSNATGVNGNQSDNSTMWSGAAYVFVRNGTAWNQQAYLKASNTAMYGGFGISAAISDETVIVGSLSATHVFVRNSDVWSQQAYFPSAGLSVAISGDTAVAGRYVLVRRGSDWSQQADLSVASDSVAISGDTIIVGAPGYLNRPDTAYIFRRTGASWNQQASFTASDTEWGDDFGVSVAISGNTAIVGAFGKGVFAGAAYVFTTADMHEFVTSVSPATPLRSSSGWVGMHIAVGDASLKVSALGRYCVAGNNQFHTVKLVSAGTKNDVPNATVSVNMASCTPGQFVYAELSTTVTLTANAHYYLVSQEVNGGDQWLELGPVTTNPGASVVGSVYFNNVSWITSGPAGTSYVPTSMKYEVQEAPTSSAFILSYNLDNRIQRNNFTGFVGLKLRIGSAALTVNSVGRGCIPGNSQNHLVKFVNAATGADIPGASATVNMAGCGTDFVYQTLASPVVLQTNTTYYLVSSETAGGDNWTDQSQLTTSSEAAVLTSIFSLGSGYAINEANAAYVPPNFLYTK